MSAELNGTQFSVNSRQFLTLKAWNGQLQLTSVFVIHIDNKSAWLNQLFGKIVLVAQVQPTFPWSM